MRASFFPGSVLLAGLLLTGAVPGQDPLGKWLEALAKGDRLARETARRHLQLVDELPVARLVRLLEHDDTAVVVAAATVLRERRSALAELRQLALHTDVAVRRAVLAVASDEILQKTLAGTLGRTAAEADAEAGAEAGAELRVRALYELEDRGRLTDDQLLAALRAEVESLADAACRIVVLERSPFPLQLVEKTLDKPVARRRLITWLADRPRSRSGPWLQRVLGLPGLTTMERIMAINSLPRDWIDHRLAKELLAAAVGEDVAASNRAAYAATRLRPEVADKLALELEDLVAAGKPASAVLPCLERISRAGEQRLLEIALGARKQVRADIFHWLDTRESKLVAIYIQKALDRDEPFPEELVRLAGPALTTPPRIAKVAAMLGRPTRVAIDAFAALIDAEVYHPAMLTYVGEEQFADARRLWRLMKLPLAKLPVELFAAVLKKGGEKACVYALESLARGPLPRELEPAIVELALDRQAEKLQAAACRALILQGSEAVGRKAWQEMRRSSNKPLAIRWLMEKPRPWSYESLLKEREALVRSLKEAADGADAPSRSTLHRVLIALAKLGDRGASDQLVVEIPHLEPAEMRQVQDLMGRFLGKAELEKLAAKYLRVAKLEAGTEPNIDLGIDDERRVDLLEWFLARRQIELTPTLTRMWKEDESYEIRLAALRGLLSRDVDGLFEELLGLLSKPFGEAQQELAFEVVGSMSQPVSRKAMDLLAHIVLLAPLTDPAKEIHYSITQPYDSGVRGAYPLLAPIGNLLRRDETARPRAAFAAAARRIAGKRYALNRQRLGMFLVGICMRDELAADLGPVIADLILEAPDLSQDFVGLAQMMKAEAVERDGGYASAAPLYAAANRAFSRGVVPVPVRAAFLGVVDPLLGYHPLAALAARSPLCRAMGKAATGDKKAAREQLRRARDLAEGDSATIEEISKLQRSLQR